MPVPRTGPDLVVFQLTLVSGNVNESSQGRQMAMPMWLFCMQMAQQSPWLWLISEREIPPKAEGHQNSKCQYVAEAGLCLVVFEERKGKNDRFQIRSVKERNENTEKY